MSRNRITLVVGLLVAFSMMLASCAPATTTPATAVPPTAAAATAVPATAVPARNGGWLDEIDYSIVDAASVVTQINAGAIDLFSYGLASDKLADIKAANLCYTQSYGTFYDFMFNAAVFSDPNVLNPFSDRKIREAMNWAIDRNYINQEIYAGGALPKFTPLATQLVDYTGVIDVARGLEAYYAYDMTKAQTQVDTEMATLGATKGTDGKWQFKGAPVTLIFLIRNDGDGTRLPQGEYFAQQLETLGFTVTRTEKKSSELSPIWIGSDPKAGLWNIYTSGWGNNGLSRDEKSIFQEMYLPDSVDGYPYNVANVPDPAFQKVGDDLANGNFTTLQQRHDLIAQALTLALQDSLQVWTVDLQTYAPFNCKLQVSADVGAGVETTKMSPYTMRIKDQVGGQVKVGSTSTMFTDPWNPVDGSNWVTSAYVQNAVQGWAFMPDPYTGLSWPLRALKADVVAQTGLPVTSSLPWVSLSTADTITVPPDAWADWDAKTQTFIPVSTKFPTGTTSKIKVVLYFPPDLFDTVKWHDGSNLSVADFVMQMIMTFDYGNPDSAIYDSDVSGNLTAFLTTFKGVKIVSTSPLVIETYSDNFYADAELDASLVGSWWPTYLYGEAPWETIAIGDIAVANKELAWGTGQADRNKVEWMSFIGGPSLAILAKDLDTAIANKTIPYAPTMSAYLTADDAVARYTALKTWYTARGHFWDGTGPYYLANNTAFIDTADRWSAFGQAPLALAALDGPAQVNIGKDAVFNVTVTMKSDGTPYATANIKEVKFLIYDAQGKTVYVGAGVAVAGSDGKFTCTAPASVTSTLVAGTGRIEAAAVLIPVAIPAFATLDYTVVP
ncbi:MAG: ABC transporter substrate-binding protein [Anaerolineales bacterium]